MISLSDYILRECEVASPSNTMGMGDVYIPSTDGEIGSGDTIVKKPKKKKQSKQIKKKKDVS